MKCILIILAIGLLVSCNTKYDNKAPSIGHEKVSEGVILNDKLINDTVKNDSVNR